MADLAVVGAGAAGLWGALHAAWTARRLGGRRLRVLVVDGRAQVGAKILMSGGTRCNLTHREVLPSDYRGASPRRVARILRAHPPEESLRVFQDVLGLPVKEEPGGKIFPGDDRAQSVLQALLSGLGKEEIPLLSGHRLVGLQPSRGEASRGAFSRGEPSRGEPSRGEPSPREPGRVEPRLVEPGRLESGDAAEAPRPWRLVLEKARASTKAGPRSAEPSTLPEPARVSLLAQRVLLAAGGCSYPRTGSDGSVLALLARLGHRVVPLVPALSPFHLSGSLHEELMGISTLVRLLLLRDGKEIARSAGPLLWTHFGVSGPAVLDLSGFWARSRADHPEAQLRVVASFLPDSTEERSDADWIEGGRAFPQRTVRVHFRVLPQRLFDALAREARVDPSLPLAQTPREHRRALLRILHGMELPVVRTAGFGKAEVTSGGIPLEEMDDGLESKILPGIHLAGEMLHVDGRLGGFNFQWAWSSGAVAGRAAVERSERFASPA